MINAEQLKKLNTMKDTILVVGCAQMAFVHGKLRHIPNHDVYHMYGSEALRFAQNYSDHISIAVTECYHPVHSGLSDSHTERGRNAGPMIVDELRKLHHETTFFLLNSSPEQERMISHDRVVFVQAPNFWELDHLVGLVERQVHTLCAAA